MSRVPLSDEKTWVIFAGEAAAGLAELDATQQEEIISRLVDIVSSDAPPRSFVYERIANLDIIAVGDQGRLYSRVVEDIPRGDARYHVIFLFFIDPYHDYPHKALAEYSTVAEKKVARLAGQATFHDAERYLEENDALDEDDLRDLLP